MLKNFQRARYSFGSDCKKNNKKKNCVMLYYLLQKLNKVVNIHVALSISLYYSLHIFCAKQKLKYRL